MKKSIILCISILITGTLYSQNDSIKVPLIGGEEVNVVSEDSLKILKNKIAKEEIGKSIAIDTIDTNKNQQAVNLNKNAIQEFVEKSIHQSTGNSDTISKGLIISGTNVIIGNNNLIIIVDDKNKAKELLQYAKDEKANKVNAPYTENLFEHFAFSLRASTLGAGVEVATTISKNIKLRAGFTAFDYSHNFTINLDDDAIKEAVVGKYNPDYKVKGKFQLYNAHVLVDFHPLRNGIFHFTGGIFYGNNTIKANGHLVDPKTNNDVVLDPTYTKWPTINFADYQLQVDGSGKLNGEIIIGNRFKPYGGIGLGRSIPRSRFGIMFELGVMYQGNITMKQNGVELSKANDLADSFVDSKDYTNWVKWMPMVNLQLIYRFK